MGYPANDIFYQDNEMKINELKKRFDIASDKKIILYAENYNFIEDTKAPFILKIKEVVEVAGLLHQLLHYPIDFLNKE